MNERRMQCTVVFLIKMLYIYTGKRSERARKPRNVVTVACVASMARGERGERGPGDQERLTDSREAI